MSESQAVNAEFLSEDNCFLNHQVHTSEVFITQFSCVHVSSKRAQLHSVHLFPQESGISTSP